MADDDDVSLRETAATANTEVDKHPAPSPAIPEPGRAEPPGSMTGQQTAEAPSPGASQVGQFEHPELPPRQYSRDPRLLVYRPPPPPRLPSQLVPKFVRYLAAFIFVFGSSATLLTVLYRTYVLPKLTLSKQRLLSLKEHNLSSFDKLLLSLRSQVDNYTSLYPKSSQLVASGFVIDPTMEISPAPVGGLSSLDAKSPMKAPAEEAIDGPADPVEVTHDLTGQLRGSLSRLSEALSEYATPDATSAEDTKASYLPEPTASQSLLSSLESFSTYLTNESFYASSPSYPAAAYGYGYGTGSAGNMPGRSGMDKENLALVRSEIRSLKGMFLTRRNFATPSRSQK